MGHAETHRWIIELQSTLAFVDLNVKLVQAKNVGTAHRSLTGSVGHEVEGLA